MKNLKPVSRVTLGEQVAAQLTDQISHGRWQPGDRLPGETELCTALRSGGSTLREALKSLAFVGMVQMRPGEDTYVMDGTQALTDHAGGLLRTEKDPRDVSEARLILETERAPLAAEYGTGGPRKSRRDSGAMKRSLDGQGPEYAVLDLAFHLAIAKSSKNRLLHKLLVPIRETLQEFIAKSQQLPGIKQIAQEHHAKIVAAQRQRNPEKARRRCGHISQLANRHLRFLARFRGRPRELPLGSRTSGAIRPRKVASSAYNEHLGCMS